MSTTKTKAKRKVGAKVQNKISGEWAIVVQRDAVGIDVIKCVASHREADRWYDVECEPIN